MLNLKGCTMRAGTLRRLIFLAVLVFGATTNMSEDIFQLFVRRGEVVILPCEFPKFDRAGPPPPRVIQWFRDKVPVFMKVGQHSPDTSPEFEGRAALVDGKTNASLEIVNVTIQDEGVYRCQVLYFVDAFRKTSNGTYVRLIVTDPPTFQTPHLEDSIVRQGESLVLKCRATGRPQPVITWWKNGLQIRSGENGILLSQGHTHQLAIRKSNTSHRGIYTCQAQSLEGKIQQQAVVKVKAPPEFLERPTDQRTREEKNALFDCKATGYPEVMRYRWYYNNVDVEISSHLSGRYKVLADGSLIIYTVIAKDKGNVTCVPDNGIQPSPKATASLFVQFRARVHDMPPFVHAGNGLKAILTCPCDADPPVNSVVWRKDGVVVNLRRDPRMYLDEHYSLIIDPAAFSDAGRYTCTPSNRIGTAGESTGTDLNVRKPPRFTDQPTDVYEAEIGKSLYIPCDGTGDPPPKVSWRKVNETEEPIHYDDTRGSLRIEPVTKHIHGVWQCVLKNSVAEVATDVQILVKYTMPHKIKEITVQPFSDSALRVSWVPGYDGGYPQYFMVWYRQTGIVDPSWATNKPNRSDNVMILGNLLPDTVYEIAVLPVNKIRSGPFSDTVTARTKALRPAASTRRTVVPQPQALFASTTSAGLLQLSWRKPSLLGATRIRTAQHKTKILGYLIEYRWTGINAASSEIKRTKRDAHEPMPEKEAWNTLTNTYENVTAVVIESDQLYRDVDYEFRALTATASDYSRPSNSVSYSTAGLTAYPCYGGFVTSASAISNPALIGIIGGVILFLLLSTMLGLCFCCRRRKSVKGPRYVTTSTTDDDKIGSPRPRINGKEISNSIVVDLTAKTNGGIRGMDRIDLDDCEHTDDADGVETPFLQKSKIKEANAVFDAFMRKNSQAGETDSKKATLSSDRSSVRKRREITPQVLLELYKRRSFADQTQQRFHKDLRLRGGTRSASTSPERVMPSHPERANLTSSFDTDGKPRIRLYSRKIDGEGAGQQRRMIVMKRKSHKSSNSDRKESFGGLASDSSESPVFAVVGTLKRTPKSRPIAESSPAKSALAYSRRERFASSHDDICDVTNRDASVDASTRRIHPAHASSPKDYYSSPDVSPNRVIARRTVEYIPDDDPSPVRRPPSRSPAKHDRSYGAKSRSLTYEQRSTYKSPNVRRDLHNQTDSSHARVEDALSSQRSPESYDRHDLSYQNPGYHRTHGSRPRTRYSYSAEQSRAMQPAPSRQQYHPSPPVVQLQNARARSRASYSYGHRHHLMSPYSPNPGYAQPLSTSFPIPSVSTHPSTSEPLTPQSTCEIDCSNSDIEVRFCKDANGNPPHDYSGRGETTITSGRGETTISPPAGISRANEHIGMTANSILPPSAENVIPHPSGGNPIENHFFPPNARNPSQPTNSISLLERTLSPRLVSSHQTRTRQVSSPHYVSPHGNNTPSSTQATAGFGSSDYGSQDLSNNSTSPMPQQTAVQAQSRAHERPARKDNSSVEENYEWDSEHAMESDIVEALRQYGAVKKSGPVSNELLNELNKITKASKSRDERRSRSADILDSNNIAARNQYQSQYSDEPSPVSPRSLDENNARRFEALRAEFRYHQQIQRMEEDGVT